MKIINLSKKPLVIRFINEKDVTTAEIENPPVNFIIPRIGEKFELFKEPKGRTNVVTGIYHNIHSNEILVWYDFFMCYKNNIVSENKEFNKLHPNGVDEKI